jgi:tetratricopeptide (TPR) repeat protein
MGTIRSAQIALLCGGFVCLSPTGALAQDPQVTAADAADDKLDEEARALFLAGRLAFEQGRYENALDYFQRAHALSKRPELLFNIGSAADRLRQDRVALEALSAYLEALPEAPNRMQVEARVRLLRRAVEQEDAQAQQPEASEPVPEPTSEPEPAREAQASRVGPIVLMAAGGALAAGGGVLLFLGMQRKSNVEDAERGARWSELESDADSAPTLIAAGASGLGVAAAVATAGVTWFVMQRGSERPSVAVSLSSDRLTVRGQF